MNAYDENLRPEEIEREIEHTRAEVSSTLDAIQSKLTPGQLMDQAIDYFRHSGTADFGSNLGRAVRDNPVPVALIGVGIAWLMASGRNGSGRQAATVRYGETTTGYEPGEGVQGSRIHDTAEGVKAKASEVADRARGALNSGREKIAETGNRARAGFDSARSRAAELGGRSQERYRETRDQFSRMIDEQPLVLGAIGVAVGAALGAALPATRREDALMGEARDGLLERAKETASEQAEAVKDAARRAGDSAAERGREPAQGTTTEASMSAQPDARVAPSPR